MKNQEKIKQNQYYNKQEIIDERGWSRGMIDKLLLAPDKETINPINKTNSIKKYLVKRVLKIEKLKLFKNEMEAVEKRRLSSLKAIENKKKILIKKMEDIVIELPKLSEQELINRAIKNYNNHQISIISDKYICKDYTKISDEFIYRMCDNYIRHNLTNYDSIIMDLKGEIGSHLAILALKINIDEAIHNHYPFFNDFYKKVMD